MWRRVRGRNRLIVLRFRAVGIVLPKIVSPSFRGPREAQGDPECHDHGPGAWIPDPPQPILGFTRDRHCNDAHIGNSRCAVASRNDGEWAKAYSGTPHPARPAFAISLRTGRTTGSFANSSAAWRGSAPIRLPFHGFNAQFLLHAEQRILGPEQGIFDPHACTPAATCVPIIL